MIILRQKNTRMHYLCVLSLLIFTSLLSTKLYAKDLVHAAIYDFFPVGFKNQNGETSGISPDIIQALASQIDYELKIHYLPVPRALNAASRGEVDLLYSYKDEVMLPGVDFLGKVGCLTSLIVPRSGIEIKNLEDLEKLRVGFVTGGYFAIRFAPNYKMDPYSLPSNETMFRMLVRGRLDAIVLNDAVLFAYRQRDYAEAKLDSNWQDTVGKPFILETLEAHISLSHGSPLQKVKEEFVNAIDAINTNGIVAQVYRKYGLPHGGSCDLTEINDAIR